MTAIAPRTGVLAGLAARSERNHPTRDWTRDCQQFCRTRFEVGPGFGTAISAWRGAEHRHEVAPHNAPYGTIGYFAPPRAGQAGHAVFMVKNGWCYSNDVLVTGRIGRLKAAEIENRWPGFRWLGVTYDVNDRLIYGFAPSVSAAAVRKAQQEHRNHRHGQQVKRELADAVGRHGMNLQTDYMGDPMREAVRALQKRLGFTQNGLIGPRLLGVLGDRRHKLIARP